MIINDTMINADCETILSELQRQLAINNIPYLRKSQDSGRNIMVQCPYHGNGQERRPSAGIRKADGVLHCFACGQVSTMPELISYVFGKNDMLGQWGMKWLVKNFSAIRIEERQDIDLDLSRNDKPEKVKIDYVSPAELDSYRYYHEYWTERGIIDENIIELFDLGFDPMTNAITFPVLDMGGNCVFVAKRSVATKRFHYPKDVVKPLYGAYQLKHNSCYVEMNDGEKRLVQSVFITESMIDCLLLWQAGHKAVALNGTGSDLQFKQLKQIPCRHFILATDNDKAGQEAREKLKRNVPNKIFSEIQFPDGIKDIGDLGKAKQFNKIKNIRDWEVF